MTTLLVGLLYLAPALLIAATLLRGRYVGERTFATVVAQARHAARPPRPARTRGRARRRRGRPARGGRLVAGGLAGRAPPRTA